MSSTFIAGNVNFNRGTIQSLILLTPTNAHTIANKEETLDERTDHLKNILDTNNSAEMGLVSAMATHHDMVDHDSQMVRQLTLGRFAQLPMQIINEKRVRLGISHWLPLSTEKLSTNKESFERAEARVDHQTFDDDLCVELILPEHTTGMGEVFAMLCNFVLDSNAMFVSADEKKRPIIAQAMNHIFALFHERDAKNFLIALDPIDRMSLAYHAAARVDRFVAAIVKAGPDFATSATIVAGTPGSIKLDSYEKAVEVMADNFKDIVKAANGGSNINPSVLICPVQNFQPKKRTKYDEPGVTFRNNANIPQQRGNAPRANNPSLGWGGD